MAEAQYQEQPTETPTDEQAEPTGQPDEVQDTAPNPGEGEQAQGDEVPEGHRVAETLTEVIESNQWDSEKFMSLRVPVKVDGKPAEAMLSDLVASYQTQEAASTRLEEAKAARQEAATVVQKAQDESKIMLGQSVALLQGLEDILMGDMKEANLAELRNTDREKYLIAKDEFAERRQALDDVKAQLAEALTTAVQGEALTPEKAAEEQQKLIAAPGMENLADEEGRKVLQTYLTSEGFSTEEIKSTADHRLFILAEKARRYDDMQANMDAASKRVVTVPTVMPAGAQNTQTKQEGQRTKASILYSK